MSEKTHPDIKGRLHHLDFGDGHWADWIALDGVRVGIIDTHIKADRPQYSESLCTGVVYWDRERVPGKAHYWTLQGAADERLTLSPSLNCTACGDHGFIEQGRWRRA